MADIFPVNQPGNTSGQVASGSPLPASQLAPVTQVPLIQSAKPLLSLAAPATTSAPAALPQGGTLSSVPATTSSPAKAPAVEPPKPLLPELEKPSLFQKIKESFMTHKKAWAGGLAAVLVIFAGVFVFMGKETETYKGAFPDGMEKCAQINDIASCGQQSGVCTWTENICMSNDFATDYRQFKTRVETAFTNAEGGEIYAGRISLAKVEAERLNGLIVVESTSLADANQHAAGANEQANTAEASLSSAVSTFTDAENYITDANRLYTSFGNRIGAEFNGTEQSEHFTSLLNGLLSIRNQASEKVDNFLNERSNLEGLVIETRNVAGEALGKANTIARTACVAEGKIFDAGVCRAVVAGTGGEVAAGAGTGDEAAAGDAAGGAGTGEEAAPGDVVADAGTDDEAASGDVAGDVGTGDVAAGDTGAAADDDAVPSEICEAGVTQIESWINAELETIKAQIAADTSGGSGGALEAELEAQYESPDACDDVRFRLENLTPTQKDAFMVRIISYYEGQVGCASKNSETIAWIKESVADTSKTEADITQGARARYLGEGCPMNSAKTADFAAAYTAAKGLYTACVDPANAGTYAGGACTIDGVSFSAASDIAPYVAAAAACELRDDTVWLWVPAEQRCKNLADARVAQAEEDRRSALHAAQVASQRALDLGAQVESMRLQLSLTQQAAQSAQTDAKIIELKAALDKLTAELAKEKEAAKTVTVTAGGSGGSTGSASPSPAPATPAPVPSAVAVAAPASGDGGEVITITSKSKKKAGAASGTSADSEAASKKSGDAGVASASGKAGAVQKSGGDPGLSSGGATASSADAAGQTPATAARSAAGSASGATASSISAGGSQAAGAAAGAVASKAAPDAGATSAASSAAAKKVHGSYIRGETGPVLFYPIAIAMANAAYFVARRRKRKL